MVAYLALFIALGGTGYAATKQRGNPPSQLRQTTTQSASPAGAYGRVLSDGSLVRSRSSNVSSVSHPSEGVYCIRLEVGATTRSGVVITPDYASDTSAFGTGGNHAVAEWRSDARDCPADRLEVLTGIHRADGSLDRRNQGFFFSVPTAPGVFSAEKPQISLPREHLHVPNPLAQLDLPPGSYSVAAKLNLARGRGDCRLMRPDINGLQVEYDAQGFDDDGTVVLQAVVTIGSPATLKLTCRRHYDPTLDAFNIKLTASRIG